MMCIANDWKDYELFDAGNGEKLERWGRFVLRRPDPQAIWPVGTDSRWENPNAWYHRNKEGGGAWKCASNMPRDWTVSYRDLVFRIELMGFKHTGLFPEQAINWDWMLEKIRSAERTIRVLNLFAYTGGATVAVASAGAEVCHVDASKGMTERAKENLLLSGLEEASVRFLVDDVVKFVEREHRRGHVYDAIILDPPSFGRGPKGQVWKVEEQLFPLLERVTGLLSDQPLFVLVNSYTTGLSGAVIQNMLSLTVGKRYGGKSSSFELGLAATSREGIILPAGTSGRWE